MGIIQSRRNAGVEETDVNTAGSAYRYPPKSGSYFGSHFIMGGQRFETSQPDAYLFGENEDLNFLGNRPVPFPYPAPQAHEPTKTLKSLVNIRRDSLRFVRESEESGVPDTESMEPATRYNIEFTFDTDVKCAITIYYFATEEINQKQAIYHPRDANMNSETFHYKRGANQTFSQPTHFINPSQFQEDEWLYNADKDVIPIVIQCVVEEEEFQGHSHMTLAVVDKSSDGGFILKPLKQKQMVDGLCYLLQEIYGIENKNTERAKDEDIDDNGSECVICMCETRDTLILPCRHLCLCNGCADNLRYQANNCPICRAKFRALLQIRAMRKKTIGGNAMTLSCQTDVDEAIPSQEGVPPGYEAVSLIEALNGPTPPHCALNMPTLPTDTTLQSLASAGQGDAVVTPSVATTPDVSDIKLVSYQDALTTDDIEIAGDQLSGVSVNSESGDTADNDNLQTESDGKKKPVPEITVGDASSKSTVTEDTPTTTTTEPRSDEDAGTADDRSSVASSSVYSSLSVISELSTSRNSLQSEDTRSSQLRDVTVQYAGGRQAIGRHADCDITGGGVGRDYGAVAPSCEMREALHPLSDCRDETSRYSSSSSSTRELLDHAGDDGDDTHDV